MCLQSYSGALQWVAQGSVADQRLHRAAKSCWVHLGTGFEQLLICHRQIYLPGRRPVGPGSRRPLLKVQIVGNPVLRQGQPLPLLWCNCNMSLTSARLRQLTLRWKCRRRATSSALSISHMAGVASTMCSSRLDSLCSDTAAIGLAVGPSQGSRRLVAFW